MHTSLVEILEERKISEDIGITFIEASSQESFLSYSELYTSALKVLSVLQVRGIQKNDELVFQIEDNRTFVIVFWACILGGIVPVPLSVGQNDDHKQKVFNVWGILNNPYLIVSATYFDRLVAFAKAVGRQDFLDSVSRKTLYQGDLSYSGEDGKLSFPKADDIAFIQFSSGSTGSPKGVMLTHRNLIANMRSISVAAKYADCDSMMSWMPLTHDMGLIGFHLNPLFCGISQYLISTTSFIRRPALWFDKATQYGVTLLCSPNFGYKYVLRHCLTNAKHAWDLSRVRVLYNGAEPIAEGLCTEFLNVMEKYGLQRHVMCPVYGLAEATLAVSISGLTDDVMSVNIDRTKLKVGDRVSYAGTASNFIPFVNVGTPVDDCSVRIVDDNGLTIGSETIGHILIQGCNVTSGYYNNAAETSSTLTGDGWLKTGDLGFIKDRALYITGRAKDIIFVNGLNFYPHDLERLAEEIEGVELNKIVIAGCFNHALQREEVIAFIFHRGSPDTFRPVAEALKEHINVKAGLTLDRIIPVKDIPRTTSGKLQRFKLIEQFNNGLFEEIWTASRQGEVVKPVNDVERKLLAIWKEVLGNDHIGVTHNFFQAGGTSLKAAEVCMKILKGFDVELPNDIVFELATVRALATRISEEERLTHIPIVGTPSFDYHAATQGQAGIFYACEVNKESTAYTIPVAVRIKGTISVAKLEFCIRQLIERHEILRASFRSDTIPEFKVNETVDFSLSVIPCSSEELDVKLRSFVQPFDLRKAPLFDIRLLQMGVDVHIFFLNFHHILLDGLSVYQFIEELFSLYSGQPLSSSSIQFKDYAWHERQYLSSGRVGNCETYWMNKLSGTLPVLELAYDYPRPAVFESKGEKIVFELDSETVSGLKRLANENACTLHALIFTLFNVMISKHTGQDEAIIGIPVSGRRHPDVHKVLGMFVNNLPIRTTIASEMTFVDFLRSTRDTLVEAFRHQDYPFEKMVRAISSGRDFSRNPIFDSMFIYQNMGFPEVSNSDFVVAPYFFDPGFSKFDISFEVYDDGKTLRYGFEYATSIFTQVSIRSLAKSFDNLVAAVLNNPFKKICDVSAMSDADIHRDIEIFNARKCAYPQSCIHELFERQCEQTPDAVAISFEGTVMSYEDLNAKANFFARVLVEKGITPGDIVAILLPRSPDFIISMLGVLKAGGCYLPIDLTLPDDRIGYLLEDSKCKFVVAETHSKVRIVKPLSVGPVLVDLPFDANVAFAADREIPRHISSSNLAYLLYTSGTTGNPKGVMVEHSALVNYVYWAAQQYSGFEANSFPFFTSVAFDLTLTSIFVPLITGNKVVIYPDDSHQFLVSKIILENKVDSIKLTPSHLKILLSANLDVASSRLKRFIVGGEQLESGLSRSILDMFKGRVKIYNEYGPTETTVGCMIHTFDPNENKPVVPIGVPAANVRIYLLDKFLKPVPAGVPGELYIAGDGVARGYLFNTSLTNQKFLPDPFVDGQRMYRTGDMAKRLWNNTIEYIGRVDKQVKLNGYRVELTEIENHLMTHPNVKEGLVCPVSGVSGQQVLCAYVITENTFDGAVLRRYLGQRIPHFMIPSWFVRIDEIPLTKNGKVDYDALPLPERSAIESSLPENEIERISLAVWKKIFDTESITVGDNFFELGGDSIKAIQIASQMFDHGIFLEVRDILTYQTIADIGARASITENGCLYEQGVVVGEMRLNSIQSWFFHQGFKNPDFYNQSVLLKLQHPIDRSMLEVAFRHVIQQHDGLRLNYNGTHGTLFFNDRLVYENFSIREYALSEDMRIDTICEEVKREFQITTTLLLKAAIIMSHDGGQYLFITAHHLVIDGVSWRILLEDLYRFYKDVVNDGVVRKRRKTASLIDCQNYIERSRVLRESAQAYWKKVDGSSFSIPQDMTTDDWGIGNQQTITLDLGVEHTEDLVKGSRQNHKFDTGVLLNTALVLALEKWTGRREVVVVHENHGRHWDDIDTSRTIGWFTAMYPVLLALPDDDSILSCLKSIRDQLNVVPDNGVTYASSTFAEQRWIYERAAVRFNYMGQFDSEMSNDIFHYSGEPHGRETDIRNQMTVALEINCMVIGGKLTLAFLYNKEAHYASTIIRFKDLFFENLEIILACVKGEKGKSFDPSDFAVDLNQEEFDALFK